MNPYVLQPRQVLSRWGELSPLLAAAVAENEGELELNDIPRMVEEHRMVVGVVEEDGEIVVALVGEIQIYPRKRVFSVCFIGGKPYVLTRHKELYAALENVAKQCKCTIIQGLCGPAATRYFTRVFGLKPVYTVLRKEVSP